MNLNFELLPWQQKVFKDNTRFKVIVAGRPLSLHNKTLSEPQSTND